MLITNITEIVKNKKRNILKDRTYLDLFNSVFVSTCWLLDHDDDDDPGSRCWWCHLRKDSLFLISEIFQNIYRLIPYVVARAAFHIMHLMISDIWFSLIRFGSSKLAAVLFSFDSSDVLQISSSFSPASFSLGFSIPVRNAEVARDKPINILNVKFVSDLS